MMPLARYLATIAALGGVAPGETLIVLFFGSSGAFYELLAPANDRGAAR